MILRKQNWNVGVLKLERHLRYKKLGTRFEWLFQQLFDICIEKIGEEKQDTDSIGNILTLRSQ